jgi:NAD(P)-dependent dehydrogenase (short-subunit alcohol dehydrogenase family)
MIRRKSMLDGKRILVTGAANGIGRAIAVELARQGANVALADIRPPEETASIITRAKGHAVAIQADVSNHADTRRMVEETVRALGGLDGLVNNAGVYSSLIPRPFEEIDLEEWRRVFDVNVFGLMSCCQAVLPQMKAQGSGRIVNIISFPSCCITLPARGPSLASPVRWRASLAHRTFWSTAWPRVSPLAKASWTMMCN